MMNLGEDVTKCTVLNACNWYWVCRNRETVPDATVQSLRFLHTFGPPALRCVNHVETYTSLCNLYVLRRYQHKYQSSSVTFSCTFFSDVSVLLVWLQHCIQFYR